MKKSQEDIEDLLEREGLRLASLDKRVLAFFIDSLIISVLVVVLHSANMPIYQVGDDIERFLASLQPMLFQAFLLDVAYHGIFTWRYGASLGKMLVKIQVIHVDLLDSPSFALSMLRALLRQLSTAVYLIPCIFAFSDTLKRTLYDRCCKTLVIEQKR